MKDHSTRLGISHIDETSEKYSYYTLVIKLYETWQSFPTFSWLNWSYFLLWLSWSYFSHPVSIFRNMSEMKRNTTTTPNPPPYSYKSRTSRENKKTLRKKFYLFLWKHLDVHLSSLPRHGHCGEREGEEKFYVSSEPESPRNVYYLLHRMIKRFPVHL